jgi:hypothetical protein
MTMIAAPPIPSLSYASTPISGSSASVSNLSGGMFNRSGMGVTGALILAVAIILAAYIVRRT